MPVNEHLFRSARLRRGSRSLAAAKTLVQVEWTEGAKRFELGSAAVVATAVADIDVPAHACPMAAGQVWVLEACGEAGTARFEVVPVRLVEIRPGLDRFRRWYTWQLLVVRRPAWDPYRLFPWLSSLASSGTTAEEENLLGELKDLLASEIADGAVARFTAEGGFDLQRA